MKRCIKTVTALTLAGIMALTAPGTGSSAATATAGSILEFVRIVREQLMAKQYGEFSIATTFSKDELNEHLTAGSNEYGDALDGLLSIEDDPTTTEDADFLIGALDMTYGDFPSEGFGEYPFRKIESDGTVLFDYYIMQTRAATDYVNKRSKEVLAELGVANMNTTYEKVEAIHDWVCKNTKYTMEGDESISTAYGVFKNGLALCNGYALAFYKLCVDAGIPCKYYSGRAGVKGETAGHAWNIVCLGDHWYYVDTTWDDNDAENTFSSDYLACGTSDFDGDTGTVHESEYGLTTTFAKVFPVAKSRFVPTLMDSENKTVKIGSSLEEALKITGEPEQYDFQFEKENIIKGTIPASGKFTVKKGKTKTLSIQVQNDMDDLVVEDGFECRATVGKNRIKGVTDKGWTFSADGGFERVFSFKAKKKGKVTIEIKLELKNGQTFTCAFTGKVK